MKLSLFFSLLVVAMAAAITGCGTTGGYNLPPASRLMEPGPGVGGPGPGVLTMPGPGVPVGAAVPTPALASASGASSNASRVIQASAVQTLACETPVGAGAGVGGAGGLIGSTAPPMEVQVLFARPEAMQVSFGTGGNSFNAAPMITPARQNFLQGGIYRLKITGLPDREGTELYPTLEVGPPTRLTAAFLAHNAIPVQFTEEDFDQVLSGNFVTKVIYLPEPEFQELALAGVETLVSTRLDPGLDPIIEADRRGSILAVVRIGNKDMELPATPSVDPIIATTNQQVTLAGHQTPVTMTVAGDDIAQVGFACSTCGPLQASVGDRMGGLVVGPTSPRGGYGPGGMPTGLVGNGQYGMPITGTPIGLPGPPHVPLGVPAGLKQHVMHNWTTRHIPDPVNKVKVNVKQRPGLSYPQPPNRAWIVEDTIHATPKYAHAKPVDPCADGTCGHVHHSGGLLGSLKRKLQH